MPDDEYRLGYVLTGILLFCLGVYAIGRLVWWPRFVTVHFNVASTASLERLPAVASNSKTGDYLVAYLEEYTPLEGPRDELRVQPFDAQGKAQGPVKYPLGSGSHKALSRPAIAYNSNADRFFVAVVERVSEGGQTWDRVIGRHLAPNGQSMTGPDFLFNDKKNTFYCPDSNARSGALHVTYNSLLDEFLVTAQFTVDGDRGVYGQTVKSWLGPYGKVVKLADFANGGFESHAIAYAPIPNTTPAGGRYLFAVPKLGTPFANHFDAWLLDSQLTPILVTVADPNNPTVPSSQYIHLNFGKPEGNYAQFDLAYGEVQGKKRFLLVYSDGDNDSPGNPSSGGYPKWTGVWATYIDPELLLYKDLVPTPGVNTPFPVTWIDDHWSSQYVYRPRVAYSPDSKAFLVVWREVPSSKVQSGAKLSHIRAARVDYFVPDGQYGLTTIPKPHANTVLSLISGASPSPWPNLGFSQEDPDFAAVAALKGTSFAVVWQQRPSQGTTDWNIAGTIAH